MPVELLVMRVLHIVGGAFWLGGGIYSFVFLGPALAVAGPAAAGPVMAGLQQRKLFTVLPVVAVLTMLSGIRLMWITTGGDFSHYFHTRMGHAYTVSGSLSVVAFALALVIARPAMVQAGALAQQMVTAAADARPALQSRLDALRRRSTVWGTVSVALLTLSGIGMAIARYL